MKNDKNLVTKKDLNDLVTKTDLDLDLNNLKTDLKTDLNDLVKDIEESEYVTAQSLNDLNSSINDLPNQFAPVDINVDPHRKDLGSFSTSGQGEQAALAVATSEEGKTIQQMVYTITGNNPGSAYIDNYDEGNYTIQILRLNTKTFIRIIQNPHSNSPIVGAWSEQKILAKTEWDNLVCNPETMSELGSQENVNKVPKSRGLYTILTEEFLKVPQFEDLEKFYHLNDSVDIILTAEHSGTSTSSKYIFEKEYLKKVKVTITFNQYDIDFNGEGLNFKSVISVGNETYQLTDFTVSISQFTNNAIGTLTLDQSKYIDNINNSITVKTYVNDCLINTTTIPISTKIFQGSYSSGTFSDVTILNGTSKDVEISGKTIFITKEYEGNIVFAFPAGSSYSNLFNFSTITMNGVNVPYWMEYSQNYEPSWFISGYTSNYNFVHLGSYNNDIIFPANELLKFKFYE